MSGLKRSSKFSDKLEARFQCECHSHEIEVCTWTDDKWTDDDIYLDFWYSGKRYERLVDRVKVMWRVLRGLSVLQEEIILRPSQAAEMGRGLLAASSQHEVHVNGETYVGPVTSTLSGDVRYSTGDKE